LYISDCYYNLNIWIFFCWTILQTGCSSGGHHVNSQMQFILPKMHSSPYGYVTPSHGWWNLPNFSGVPILPQAPQVANLLVRI